MAAKESGKTNFLKHMGMFAHPNPKCVAIIGGGEGVTLSKNLKQKTVDVNQLGWSRVKIDEELVKMCQEHLPEWSDCSNMEGSGADFCANDSMASPKPPVRVRVRVSLKALAGGCQ